MLVDACAPVFGLVTVTVKVPVCPAPALGNV
jgi:hypothetical protein